VLEDWREIEDEIRSSEYYFYITILEITEDGEVTEEEIYAED